jgi:Four helix bundle sensory module for signal transduction
MKWIYGMDERNKPALLLLVIVITILASNFLEKKLITDMGKSISSIYEDRLVPAAGLFHIHDLMFTKRLALEAYLLNPEEQSRQEVSRQMVRCNARIDSLIQAYEETYLVEEESRKLKEFKLLVRQYNILESLYLSAHPGPGQLQSYARQIGPIFKKMHGGLMSLSHIQTAEGRELLEDSRVITGNASLISNLQIAMVVVIALAVQALLRSSRRLIPKKLQNFRLN